MDAGITRVFLKLDCGRVVPLDISPHMHIRDTIEYEIELYQKLHSSECEICGSPLVEVL